MEQWAGLSCTNRNVLINKMFICHRYSWIEETHQNNTKDLILLVKCPRVVGEPQET